MNSNNPNEAIHRVTEQDVWDVANSLWVKKIDPSTNKIRDLLGRGSNRTILMHLETWRQKEWEQPCADDPLWQELTKIRKKVEHQANTAALKKIQEIQEQCGHKIIAAQLLQQTTQLECDDLAKKLQTSQKDLEILSEAHQKLTIKFNAEEKKLYEAELNNKHLENAMFEQKKQAQDQLNAQSIKYEKEISQLNKQIDQNQKLFDEKIVSLNKVHDELKQSLVDQITDLRLKNHGLSHALDHAKSKERVQLVELEKINAKYKMSQEEILKLTQEKQAFIEIKHQFEKELTITQISLQQSNAQIDEIKKQNVDLQQQLLDYSLKIGQLNEKILSLERERKYTTSDAGDL